MEKIEELQKENELLSTRLKAVEDTVIEYKNLFHSIMEQLRFISHVMSKRDEINVLEHEALRATENNLPFEMGDPRKQDFEFYYPTIIDAETSIQQIIDGRKSIARFGDGEFAIICGWIRHAFQKFDAGLAKRLKQVLQSDLKNLMIGIADNYGNLDRFTVDARDGIRQYMQEEVRKQHMQLLSKDKVYYDAYLSRPYVIHKDHFTDAPKKRFDHLKQIWANRDVIMVEGVQTRLGVGNDLFDGCKSVRRILISARDAFSRYQEILDAALKAGKQDDLFLLAAGPTAGVLAYDLTLEGFQAVDIGHVDIEYEWFLKGTGKRESICYKYTNEIPGGEAAEDIQDPVYESQIIGVYS